MFTCRFCQIETNTWKDHLKHLIEDHSESSCRLYCGFNGCKKAITSESHIIKHLFKMHSMSVQKGQTMLTDILNNNYKCTAIQCPLKFEDYNFLIKHLRVHIFNGVSIQCPFPKCGSRYSHEWFFDRHLKKCHVAVLDDFQQEDGLQNRIFKKVKQENDCESITNESTPLDLSGNNRSHQSSNDEINNNLPLSLLNCERLNSRHLDILQQASFIKTSLQLNKRNLKKKSTLAPPLEQNMYHTQRMLRFMQSIPLPWHRFPLQLLNSCDNRERTNPAELQLMVNVIAEHLCHELKDKSLEIVIELADKICQEFPSTFANRVDDGIRRSDWLAARIYAAVHSRRDLEVPVRRTGNHQIVYKTRRRKRKASEAFDGNSQIENENIPSHVCCVETRQMSIGLLKQPKYFVMFASSLLSIDATTTWCRGLSQNRIIYEFLITKRCAEIKKEALGDDDLMKILEEFSIVECLHNDQARTIAVFPLIIKYFKEDPNFLYIILDSATPDEVMKLLVRTTCPILVVRGKSLYDVNASCTVFVNGEELMRGVNVLQGFLIVFLSYFVFRIDYSRKVQKTLQVIQRLIMDINPTEGNHGRGERPQYKTIHFKVRKFMDQIKIFRNHQKIVN